MNKHKCTYTYNIYKYISRVIAKPYQAHIGFESSLTNNYSDSREKPCPPQKITIH